jgi:hypothetical protein
MATVTLEDRAAKWGKKSPWLVDWIHAQDTVFANCTGTAVPASPGTTPSDSPALLQADRAYQSAAAAFYAGQDDAARSQFEAIAHDLQSPWHGWGQYLAARAVVRKAFAMGSKTDPWSAELASFDMKTMQEAQAMLEALQRIRTFQRRWR